MIVTLLAEIRGREEREQGIIKSKQHKEAIDVISSNFSEFLYSAQLSVLIK